MSDHDHDTQIAALGRLCHIAPRYWDNGGNLRITSTATYEALLTALGVPWEERQLLAASLATRRARLWQRFLEPVVIFRQESEPGCLHAVLKSARPEIPDDLSGWIEITGETGEARSWEIDPAAVRLLGVRPREAEFSLRLTLPLPGDLDLGYYDLTLHLGSGGQQQQGRSRLIAAPPRAYQPPALAAERRLWGLGAPLYALRSRRNWGMGDFRDLHTLTTLAGELGAAFVGVNPLHASAPSHLADMSPYAPTSRVAVNFLYLDLEAVPELADSPEARVLAASADFQESLQRLRDSRLVQYPDIFRLKRRVLGLCWQGFLDRHGPPEAPRTGRGREFARFVQADGIPLEKYGRYAALVEILKQADWRRWPAGFHHPDGPDVADFAARHRQLVLFHQYVQWLTASQLESVWAAARRAGLPFSLYQDLALGSGAGGFETWAHPGLFARGVSMGAPPDAFNLQGQNWGLPPMIPEKLRESGYRLFIDTLRANCPPDGILRLDHVMGMFRLFCIPAGAGADQGTYIYYPAREFLAILALESVRRRTLIIGEDLGTVAPRVRKELARQGMYSYKVFYFERTPTGACRPPGDYPRQALATITTHDLPTLAGYWEGRDMEVKERLHLYQYPGQAAADAAARPAERERFVQALAGEGLIPPGREPHLKAARRCPEAVRLGVAQFLGKSQAALVEIRLEEVLGVRFQQNLPGTIREHPNWRWKLPALLEDLAQMPQPRRLAQIMGERKWEAGEGPGR